MGQQALLPEDEVARWEAQAEYDIGVLIRRYLQENAPPPESQMADELAGVARDLQDVGSAHLRRLGQDRLRIARPQVLSKQR